MFAWCTAPHAISTTLDVNIKYASILMSIHKWTLHLRPEGYILFFGLLLFFGVFRDRRKSSIPTPSPPSSKTLESKVANSDGGDAIFVVFDNMISTEVLSRTRRQQGVDQHRHGRSCTGVEQSGSGGGLLVLILDSLVFVLASRPVGTYVGASAMYVFNGFPNAQGARRGKEARSGNS